MFKQMTACYRLFRI